MKHKSHILISLFLLILFAVPLASIACPDSEISVTEKRPLTQLTGFSQYVKTQGSADLADYLAYLEKYLLDQFPLRDRLRAVNAMARVYGLGQRDHNLYYRKEGHLSKLDPLLRPKAVERALSALNRSSGLFSGGQGKHLFALIPDKNAFLAEGAAYPHYSYDDMLALVEGLLSDDIRILPLFELLTLDDYYRTDPHWDQSKLVPLASCLLEELGVRESMTQAYQLTEGLTGYYGTYAGQAALPVTADRLLWLTSQELEGMILYDPVSQETSGIYQEEQLDGMDPYDIFLGGAKALLSLRNPDQKNGRQLVVFRDSFGSSLIPLLASAYSEILILDLRYITVGTALKWVDFDQDADVLYLYSSSVLNSPGAFLE